MRVDRIERCNVYRNLSDITCEVCRKQIETHYLYMLLFAPNRNNGKYAVLCGECAKELKATLNKKVDNTI